MSNPNPFAAQSSTLIDSSHLQKLNDALRSLNIAEREANLLQQAGVDQTATLTQIMDQRAKIIQFKSVYFPGQ